MTSSLAEALPELKRQARLAGCDAIIEITERRSEILETRVYHVTAIGIRYPGSTVVILEYPVRMRTRPPRPGQSTGQTLAVHAEYSHRDIRWKAWAHIVTAATVMLLAYQANAAGQMKQFQVEETTIGDVQAAYKSGATTATHLVQAYLDRIRAYDAAGPKLNVVISLNPTALEEAAALDEHLRTTGKFVGSLHGIPVLLKDNVNTKDMPTTGGSLSLAGYTPASDATITQKLRAARGRHPRQGHSARVRHLGRDDQLDPRADPESLRPGPDACVARVVERARGWPRTSRSWASAPTQSTPSVHTAVRKQHRGNPTNARSRQPRGCNTLFVHPGCRGPLARTVTDAVKMLNVLVGYDPMDAATAWSVGNAQKDYSKYLQADGVKGKRIGVLRSFFGNAPGQRGSHYWREYRDRGPEKVGRDRHRTRHP